MNKKNIFSFTMPWQDIERCCYLATQSAKKVDRDGLRELQEELGVPHSEETLALMVHVQIRGGSKDLTQHIQGITMRVEVIQNLIEILQGVKFNMWFFDPFLFVDSLFSAARFFV